MNNSENVDELETVSVKGKCYRGASDIFWIYSNITNIIDFSIHTHLILCIMNIQTKNTKLNH